MTVSELINKLKDCAPGATVRFKDLFDDSEGEAELGEVKSNGWDVFLS